jgi:Fe-S-cluster containining protein
MIEYDIIAFSFHLGRRDMPERERLFFTIDQALSAVCHAFAQYPIRFNLLSVIWPTVFGDGAYVLQDGGNRSVWAKIPGAAKLIPSSEADLKQRITSQLKRCPPEPGGLARICSRVFGAPVVAGYGPEPDRSPGIWVETDMTGFACIQCGHCCRTLKFHDGCTLSDYHHWLDLKRTDILDWVGTVRHNGHITACRIWIIPGTNEYAQTCPWLATSPGRDHYICTIHDVRPTICRQYPGSRKHARMTGCRGI